MMFSFWRDYFSKKVEGYLFVVTFSDASCFGVTADSKTEALEFVIDKIYHNQTTPSGKTIEPISWQKARSRFATVKRKSMRSKGIWYPLNINCK